MNDRSDNTNTLRTAGGNKSLALSERENMILEGAFVAVQCPYSEASLERSRFRSMCDMLKLAATVYGAPERWGDEPELIPGEIEEILTLQVKVSKWLEAM
jgi:hypothetical protein